MTDDPLVLLVDDEPWFSESLAFTLEAKGFKCLTATSMTAALEILERDLVRVLVTDIMMPGGDKFLQVDAAEAGFRLIDIVQKRWPRLPVICLSVIGDQTQITSLTRRGIRYLRKGETPLSTAVEVIAAIALGRNIRL